MHMTITPPKITLPIIIIIIIITILDIAGHVVHSIIHKKISIIKKKKKLKVNSSLTTSVADVRLPPPCQRTAHDTIDRHYSFTNTRLRES
jgi:hypothetical protein